MNLKEWQIEYLYYLHPDIPVNAKQEMIKRYEMETDFESEIAKGFYAGWQYREVTLHQKINNCFEFKS